MQLFYEFNHIMLRYSDTLSALRHRPAEIIAKRKGSRILSFSISFSTFPLMSYLQGLYPSKFKEEKASPAGMNRLCLPDSCKISSVSVCIS